MNLINETKSIMKKYGITANKRLGQNFLVDDEAVETIASTPCITKDDLIIEIGPGLRNSYKVAFRKSRKSNLYRIR